MPASKAPRFFWTNGPAAGIVEGESKKEVPFFVTVTVNAGRCIGCGMCAHAAPEVFRIEGAVSTVISQPEKRDSRVSDAANGCPVNAISIK